MTGVKFGMTGCLGGEYLREWIIFCNIVNMNAIITVVGSDKVGIISKVSSFLADHKINIEDITDKSLKQHTFTELIKEFAPYVVMILIY